MLGCALVPLKEGRANYLLGALKPLSFANSRAALSQDILEGLKKQLKPLLKLCWCQDILEQESASAQSLLITMKARTLCWNTLQAKGKD